MAQTGLSNLLLRSRICNSLSTVWYRKQYLSVATRSGWRSILPSSTSQRNLDSPQRRPHGFSPPAVRYSTPSDIEDLMVDDDGRQKIGFAAINGQRGMVSVSWFDGETQDYPFVWLLDSCQCPDCYHPGSQSRCLPFTNLDVNAKPESVETANNGSTLRVLWNRHHCSDFDSMWLRNMRFQKTPSDEIHTPTPKLWGAEKADSLLKFDYQEVLSNDQILYEFLKVFCEYGIVLLENAPAEQGQIFVVAKRIGAVRDTGLGILQQLKKGGDKGELLEEDRSVIYITSDLQLHTDQTCLAEAPCMMFLHCIKPALEGGESLFSDGFKASETLRREDPAVFDLLSTSIQEFRITTDENFFGDIDHRSFHPPILLNPFGQLKAIHYSTHARWPSLRIPVDDVRPMYCALHALAKLFESPENMFQIKLREGEMMVVNNHRVLHGRTAFGESAERHLELGYVDWDFVASRMRDLKRRLHREML